MKAYHCTYAFALSVVIAIGGCVPQATLPIPSATIDAATSTPASNARYADTTHPEKPPTIVPIFTRTQTLTPEPPFVSGWFPIPKLTTLDTIDFRTARLFKGLKIPPLPNELVIELHAIQPYREVPPDTIFYQLFLVRKGNARMLWLG